MNFFKRWYTYQKERFPVLVYGLYILAIVIAVFCFNTSIKVSRYEEMPKELLSEVGEISISNPYVTDFYKIIPMFIVAFLQFLMVRIVDEFKDYDEDCKYRPYRPVPRGLISLKELKVLFIICAILQLLITLNYGSILWLLIMWLFFAIMSKGFFIKKFLDKHILIEVFFDELLLPLLVLYLSSFVPVSIFQHLSSFLNLHSFVYDIDYSSIWKLLLMSYIVSWIVEIARKIRCKEDEENGVKTYTAVFGIKKAVLILFILETLLMIAQTIILGTNYVLFIIITYMMVNLANIDFVKKQGRKEAKITELSANIYSVISYLSLGFLII